MPRKKKQGQPKQPPPSSDESASDEQQQALLELPGNLFSDSSSSSSEEEVLQPDELVPEAFTGEIRGDPPGLCANLLPFQVEGLSWMYNQEVKTETRGGILADEMGMGKTLQTIATILDNRSLLQHSQPHAKHPVGAPDLQTRKLEETLWAKAQQEWAHEMEMCNIPASVRPKQPVRAGTLVVCPLVALSQWKAEIEKFTKPNTLSVAIYHGTNRNSEFSVAKLRKYDIVLTTYQVIEAEYRKMVSPNKVTCPNCKAKFKIDKLAVHLKYFCGEGAERTEAQARQRRGFARRGGGKTTKKQQTKAKTKTITRTKAKTAPVKRKRNATKQKVTAKKVAGYDTDSSLSVDAAVVTPPGSRAKRAAAASANKKLKTTYKELENDEESSGWSKSSVDDDSSEEETASETEAEISSSSEASEPKTRKKARVSPSSHDSDSSDSLDESETQESNPKKRKNPRFSPRFQKKNDNEALARAKQKQAEALAAAKKNKKPKKAPMTKASNKKTKPKLKRISKKFDSDGSSSGSSSSDEESARDPMEGIDMKKLTKEAMKGCRFSILHAFSWFRIVLDEAHFIKSRSSQTAHAAYALTSIHRWCLSGTPLQNRVGELYSLIRFLRLDPMAHYFCRIKGCGCSNLHYRIKQGVCLDCGHRGFSHYAHFNRHVLNPIQKNGYSGVGRDAMITLKDEVLDKCLLRRTKETRAEDMNLPPRLVNIRYVRLHPVEEDFYQALYSETKTSFDDYVAEGTLENNYAHIFDLLSRLRQAVDHPYLIVYSKTAAKRNAESKAIANGTVDCEMCHEPPTDRILSSCCGAGYCRSCVLEYLTVGDGTNTPCPSCGTPFTIDLNQATSTAVVDDSTLTVSAPKTAKGASTNKATLKEMTHVATGSILRRINLAEFATSTKIEVLVQELVDMRSKRPGSKALVFSQFVNMLDLVRWRLHSDPNLARMGLGFRILHGGMDVKSRDAALKAFKDDPDCRVLLLSLKAAGVALNLTRASECFLMDLWWNPAAEMQAIDRCHRLGQHRPIRAVRLVAEGTVEERVLELQEKKRLVFDGTVGRDAGSLQKLGVDDMKAMFC